jgi:hypothetical protein
LTGGLAVTVAVLVSTLFIGVSPSLDGVTQRR